MGVRSSLELYFPYNSVGRVCGCYEECKHSSPWDHNVAGSIPAGGVLEMHPISKIPCVSESGEVYEILYLIKA